MIFCTTSPSSPKKTLVWVLLLLLFIFFPLYFFFNLIKDNKLTLPLYGSSNPRQKTTEYNPQQHIFLRSSSTSSSSRCASVPGEVIEKAIKDSVKERTVYDGWGGAPYTQSSLARVHPCIRRISEPWYLKDVLFIVMASRIQEDRAKTVLETWGKTLLSTNNLLILGDEEIPEIGMVTLPDLENQRTKADAPHRTLKGLQYVVQNPDIYGKYAWIFMVDDDTWVNIYELPSLLFGWDVRAPFMLSFIWNNPIFATERPRTWPSGGAGMLVTRAAAEILAKNLYTEVCPFDTENDRTIGHCAWRTGIALVHSPLFDPESLHALSAEAAYYRAYGNDGDIRSLITMHRAEPEYMREWHGIVERYPMDNRLALVELDKDT